MGKKRASSSYLSKGYTSTSPAPNHVHGTSSLSVADKLSQLRLEGLRHQRNVAGTAVRSSSDIAHSVRSLQITPDVSQLLGEQYVEPKSRARPRDRGHLAPRSWTQSARHSRSQVIHLPSESRHTGCQSLVDLCLKAIAREIHDYRGLGMNFLPGYMKSRLLASLTSANHDIIWADILPDEDDEISALDLSLTMPKIKYLRRLTGLREVTLSIAQIEFEIVPSLPSVLRELVIRPFNDMSSAEPYRKAYWRRLSSHFIALRTIRLDLQCLDIHNQITIDALLGSLLEGPDWREAFDTVDEIIFEARNDKFAAILSSSLPFFGFKGSLRKIRRRGRHVECTVVSPKSAL